MIVDYFEYPFLEPLVEEWQTIRGELLALEQHHFRVWSERQIYNGDWKGVSLVHFGRKIEETRAVCPRTTQLVDAIPGLTTALFSQLGPGTYIGPHHGYTDRVLRCHLGLVVPKSGCALRVGSDTRAWAEGDCFVFDDSLEHEAWNRSTERRVVLLVDFKRDINEEIRFPDRVYGDG